MYDSCMINCMISSTCTVLSEFVFRVYKYTKLILILFEFVFRVNIGLYIESTSAPN